MIVRIIIDLFLIFGCFFAFAGAIGLLRMPDSFTRMQSSTNIATFGVLWTVLGIAVYAFANNNFVFGVKTLMIGVFIILTSAIGGHAILKGGYKHGIRPDNLVVDEYRRDNPNE